MHFNDLRRANAGISQQTLTRELRALEKARVITRTVFPQVPPRVEYSLSDAGERLMQIIDSLGGWWKPTQPAPTA